MTPRASALPPEQRRAAIVRAALPLLEQHGPAFTTRMVADAAGVAEGTIFRVFPTLGDLLEATYVELLSAERLQEHLAAVDLGNSLEARVEASLRALVGYLSSVHMVLRPSMRAADTPPHIAAAGRCYLDRAGDLRAWLDDVFQPYADRIALPVPTFSHLLATLAIGLGRSPAPIPLDDVTHFALHGALRGEHS